MPIPARSALVWMAVTLTAAEGLAQPVPTPEDEVLAMLREWRALRASGRDPLGMLVQPTAEVAESAVPQASPDAPPRIRIGTGVQEQALISGSQPVYPEE